MDKRHFMNALHRLTFEKIEDMTETDQRIAHTHWEYLQRLATDDVIVLAGRTEHAELGIVIVETESEDAAREIMESAPAVKHGLMRATFYPYRLALMRGADQGV